MSKKVNTNPKAAEAREREKEKKKIQSYQEEERKEAEKWVEKDKNVLKKLDKKNAQDEKKEEERRRQEEKRALQEADDQMFKDKKTQKKEEENKLTKAELKRREAELVRREQAKHMGIDLDQVKKEKKEAEKTIKAITKDIEERKANGEDIQDADKEEAIEEALSDIKPNLNHARREQALLDAEKYDGVIEASGLENALDAMGGKAISHPEKRVKAAWEEFLEKRLPEMKVEYPGFKRSKHIDMLRKEWEKSPENPFNKNIVAYNEK